MNMESTGLWERIQQGATSERDPEDGPHWIDVFPEQVDDLDRAAYICEDFPDYVTYGRKGSDDWTRSDQIRIEHRGGRFVGLEQVDANGRTPGRTRPERVVFEREEPAAAADALVQYLLDGVEPGEYYDPGPNRVWPPEEDLFTADLS